MKRLTILSAALAAVLTIAGSAYAWSNNCPGGDAQCVAVDKANDVNANHNVNKNTNTANGGAGGAGGQGGQGGKGGDSKATATGGNANQSQGQIQQQTNQIKNSGNSSSKSTATGGTGVGVGVAGASANGNVTVTEGSTKAIGYASAPAMGTASLVAAPETCMGSASGGIGAGNGIISGGLSFGKTYESENCNRRMNARYLISLAQMTHDDRFLAATVALLGQDENVAKAYEAAGIEIPGKKKDSLVKADDTDGPKSDTRDSAHQARTTFDRQQIQSQ